MTANRDQGEIAVSSLNSVHVLSATLIIVSLLVGCFHRPSMPPPVLERLLLETKEMPKGWRGHRASDDSAARYDPIAQQVLWISYQHYPEYAVAHYTILSYNTPRTAAERVEALSSMTDRHRFRQIGDWYEPDELSGLGTRVSEFRCACQNRLHPANDTKQITVCFAWARQGVIVTEFISWISEDYMSYTKYRNKVQQINEHLIETGEGATP